MSAPVPVEVQANEPRELHCQLCDREHPPWFAPSDLWNAVMRDGNRGAPDRFSYVCPVCFMKLAEAQGFMPTAWVLSMEEATDA